jgi:transcription termination/antitermination protein NusG
VEVTIAPHIIEEGLKGAVAIPANRPQWYAIQTRGRHEKRVAAQLRNRGFDGYLPLSSEYHQWTDRRKMVEAPLYPCYTFLRASIDERIREAVLRIPGVLDFVGLKGCPLVIPDRDIEVIKTLVARCVPVKPHVYLSEGTRVRIRGGALDGIEGILLKRNSDSSLIVSIQLIQRSISLRVDGYDVEPL